MKNNILLATLTLILAFSCKKEKIELNTTNYLQEFSKVKTQNFDLDTLSYYEIIGKKGTIIDFIRSDFQIKSNEKVTAELTEIYDFKDIILNNLNTITDKNELLESNGVIRIEFKSNGKKVPLKKDSFLRIQFPENRLKNNDVFIAEVNSINKFSWVKEDQTHMIFNVNVGTIYSPILVERIIRKDSLSYYKKREEKSISDQLKNKEVNKLDYKDIALLKEYGWINIDKIVNPDSEISFKLIPSNSQIKSYCSYIIYENLNSFVKYCRHIDYLDFNNIKIKNKTWLIVTSKVGEEFFAQKILLNKIKNNSKINLNLKQSSKKEIVSLLIDKP